MPLTNAGAQVALDGPGLVAVTRWLSLHVGDPSATGVEVSAAGYARLQRTAAQLAVTNNAVVVAAAVWEDSAHDSWGAPDFVGVHSAATGGDLLAYDDISPALSEVLAGTRVFSEAGDITITIPLS